MAAVEEEIPPETLAHARKYGMHGIRRAVEHQVEVLELFKDRILASSRSFDGWQQWPSILKSRPRFSGLLRTQVVDPFRAVGADGIGVEAAAEVNHLSSCRSVGYCHVEPHSNHSSCRYEHHMQYKC